MVKAVLKISVVLVSAVTITALGIDAADTLSGSRSTMLAALIKNDQANMPCPAGMIEVPSGVTFTCVDIYEATTGVDCPVRDPQTVGQTKDNLASAVCSATSRAGEKPWRFISRAEAQLACARSGKRLPTASEWYSVALGTPQDEQSCNQETGIVSNTGSYGACQSAAGVFDAVGNVWEWVSDDVFDGVYNGRPLPAEGYVSQVDAGGVSAVTTDVASTEYGSDYLWSKESGAFGMMRGGFYNSHSDAGVFTVHAATDPNFVGTAVGFRCVQ